jgi:Alpha/beta hydrolase domain
MYELEYLPAVSSLSAIAVPYFHQIGRESDRLIFAGFAPSGICAALSTDQPARAPQHRRAIIPAVTVDVRIRADNRRPVLILEREGDIVPPLSFGLARQPDSDWLRLWETAGTAHADADTLGAEQARLLGVDWRINEGPHRFLAQAALHALHAWVCEGTPPPRAARIELASQQPPVIARDQYGIALGGVRPPAVDVLVVTLSGQGPPGAAGPGWLARPRHWTARRCCGSMAASRLP